MGMYGNGASAAVATMSSGQVGGRNGEHWNRCRRIGNVLQHLMLQASWKNGGRRGVATLLSWASAACCTSGSCGVFRYGISWRGGVAARGEKGREYVAAFNVANELEEWGGVDAALQQCSNTSESGECCVLHQQQLQCLRIWHKLERRCCSKRGRKVGNMLQHLMLLANEPELENGGRCGVATLQASAACCISSSCSIFGYRIS
jgi:hypothetical protein